MRTTNEALFYLIQQVKSLILELDFDNNGNGAPYSSGVHDADVVFYYTRRFQCCDSSIDRRGRQVHAFCQFALGNPIVLLKEAEDFSVIGIKLHLESPSLGRTHYSRKAH
ncbi:hypothetical protein D3C71_1834020 [compost metagenome]